MAVHPPSLVIEPRHQADLNALDEHFRDRENDARRLDEAPAGTWVIIRCDGVRANKRFLSQTLHNPRFASALSDATKQVCLLYRSFAPQDARPYVAGALVISDEVSFIVNRGPNYHERRLWKLATTLCSALAAAMSIHMERAARDASESVPEHPQIINFDARPLVLAAAADVIDYIRWRRLLATRNALAKALRLGGHCAGTTLYETHPRLADDFVAIARLVEVAQRWQDVRTMMASNSLHLFNAVMWLDCHPAPPEPMPAGQTFELTALFDAVPGAGVGR